MLLLLAVVGFGTHSNAQTLVGPAGVNDGIKLWLHAAEGNVKRKNNCSTKIKPWKTHPKFVAAKCWKDISGNNAHVISKLSSKTFGAPKWVSNGIGGEPALYFVGPVQEDGLIKELSNSDKWESDYTLFLVVKQEYLATPQGASYFSSGHQNKTMQIGHGADDTTKDSVWVWAEDSEGSSTKFTSSSEIESRIYAVRDGETKRRTYTNGKLESTHNIENSRRFTHYQINLDRTRTIFNSSYIAEVVLYDRNLNDCEFYDVHKYLADKYELLGMPTHKIEDDGSLIEIDVDNGPNHYFLENASVIGEGDADYIVIHGTGDSNLAPDGSKLKVHTKGDDDYIYIKDWGTAKDIEINGASENWGKKDTLIIEDSIYSSDQSDSNSEYFCPAEEHLTMPEYSDYSDVYPETNCERTCFKTGGSICLKDIEAQHLRSHYQLYGGLEDPPGGCEEDVCVGGNIAPVGVPAPVSFSSRSLGSDTLVFLGEFDFDDWSGDLKAYALEDDGSLGDQKWSAAARLVDKDLSTNTDLTSYNESLPGENPTSTGKKFQWDGLEGIQINDLEYGGQSGEDRLEYLRGSSEKEETNDGPFRSRNSRLGDIFRSRPVYVGVPNLAWPDTGALFPDVATTRYSDFKNEQQCRTPMVYVGANDGALHGFRVEDGKEVLRYFPGDLYNSSNEVGYHFLTDPAYDHLPYVDGTPVVSDAYIKKSATATDDEKSWRTILVGTLGGGGTGLFALDVTGPNACGDEWPSTEDNVLWEFTQNEFEDLGYSYSRPTIALLNNGRWAAITGNGDIELGGISVPTLLILYLDGGLDGSWSDGDDDYLNIYTTDSDDLNDVDTSRLSEDDLEGQGLSSPTVIDTDGDGDADRVYAGDTRGNLWAFDLSSPESSKWNYTFNRPRLLFENTRDDLEQPITVKPTVVRHPTVANDNSNAPNVMVLFGTGRLNTDDDKSDRSVQSFYGIWDSGVASTAVTTIELEQQSFIFEDENSRITDASLDVQYPPKFGWYIDLPADTGERVVSDAVARGDMIFFNTVIPTDNPCEYGGTGWEMSVRIENGGSPMTPVVDHDLDGVVDNKDTIEVNLAGGSEPTAVGHSGKKVEDDEGLPSGPAIVGDKLFTRGSNEGKLPNNTALAPVTDNWPVGRLSWEQLFHSQ